MQRQRRNSLILAAVCVLAAAGAGAAMNMGRPIGSHVVVFVDGVEKARYALSEEREIDLKTENTQENVTENGTNLLQIRDGKAKMTGADCPDQLCVNQRAINKVGETIVCLPHRIVIEVEGAEKSDLDAIAN